jgi:hypothetical protein
MDLLLSGGVSSSLQRWLRDSLLGVYDEFCDLSQVNQDKGDLQEGGKGGLPLRKGIMEVYIYMYVCM